MPFCPKCRDEFQDWAKTCPDCRVRLVAELRAETEPTPSPGHAWRHTRPARDSNELVRLASASNETEARMWAGVLEDKGIRTMVKTYEGGGFRYPPVSSIMQPSNLQFDVYVLESHVERAREILGRMSDPTSRPDRPRRATKSAEAKDELVAVASPSNALESMTWAEKLENNGIHCFDKSVSQYSTGASYPHQQIYVLRSDVAKARKILGRISDCAAGAEPSDGQLSKKRRFSTTAAGIVDVANGVVYICLAVGLTITTDLDVVIPIAIAAIGVLAIAGGICTLLRKNWWIAVAGAIVSMVPFFPPFLMSGSRDEFE